MIVELDPHGGKHKHCPFYTFLQAGTCRKAWKARRGSDSLCGLPSHQPTVKRSVAEKSDRHQCMEAGNLLAFHGVTRRCFGRCG